MSPACWYPSKFCKTMWAELAYG